MNCRKVFEGRMIAGVGVILVFAILILLNVGYYDISEESEPDKTVFFLKKSPTFQMRFINLATASWGGDMLLNDESRQSVIDYCKYRLGIDTQLENSHDLARCTAP